MLIKIRVFSSFGSETGCVEAFIRVNELLSDPEYGKRYCFVTGNDEDYTHALILNTAMPDDLRVDKSKVVGLAFEPTPFLGLTPEFIEYARKRIGVYHIGEVGNLPSPFKEGFSYMWHLTPLAEKVKVKTRGVSMVISEKLMTDNHKYRHRLCTEILTRRLPVDIWGRGCDRYSHISSSDSVKGVFEEHEPYIDYMYTICVENFCTPHYFSEKIMNPLLCSCTPVYLGAKKIDEYFPNQVISLCGDLETDIGIIRDVCDNLVERVKKVNVKRVKRVISVKNIVKGFCV